MVSLFAYAHAPYAALMEGLRRLNRRVVLVATQGVVTEALRNMPNISDGIELRMLPFLPQTQYDELLWACDINFVRGEDSFARAQWSGIPFVWHIYSQDEAIHLAKLDAFVQCFGAHGNESAMQSLRALWRAWNGAHPLTREQGATDADGLAQALHAFCATLPHQREAAVRWARHLAALGDLAGNLVQFVKKTI